MKKKYKLIYKILSILIVIVILLGFCHYENNHITLTKYEYKTSKLRTDKSYKIIQISDFHNKKMQNNNESLIQIVRDEQPDIIVITGDYIDSIHTQTDVALTLTAQLTEIAPVYFITGNHEYSIDIETLYEFEAGLQQLGVNVLYNTSVPLGDGINLIGLDDLCLNDGTLNNIMDNLSSDDLNILLAHEPQYINDYAKAGVDIVLSGHAHGGQIRIPFTGIGLIAPGQGLFPKYTAGEYTKDNTTMFVSRGIGNSILPLRIFNCPEIVEIEIIPN